MQTESKLLDYSYLSEIRWYRPIVGEVDPASIDPLAGESRTCRDCSALLREVDNVYETAWSNPAAILACDKCGWWCQYSVGFNRDGFYEWEKVPAALRTYAVSDIEVPVNALRRELTKNLRLLAELHPTKMEELVGAILSDFMDCEVVHTGRTGDGGIDLLLLDGDTPYVEPRARRDGKRNSRVPGGHVVGRAPTWHLRDNSDSLHLGGYRCGCVG
jgi:hypothetical protein